MLQRSSITVIALVIVVIAMIAYTKKSKQLMGITILVTVIFSILIISNIMSQRNQRQRLLSLGSLKVPFPAGPNKAIMKVRVDDGHTLYINRAGATQSTTFFGQTIKIPIWNKISPQTKTAGGLTTPSIETEYDFTDDSGISTGLSSGDVIRIDCYNAGTSNNPAGLFFYIQFINNNNPYGSIPDIVSNSKTVFLDQSLTTPAVAVNGGFGTWNLSDPISVAKTMNGASWVWNSGCVNCNCAPNPPSAPISFYIPITPTTASSNAYVSPPGGLVFIENASSNNRLESGGGSGNDAVAYANDYNSDKQWTYNQSTLTLTNLASGHCLENGGNQTGGNAVKAIIGDDGSNNKKWVYNYQNSTLCNKQTGLCLENVPGGNGNTVQAFSDDGNCNKKWIFIPVT
jgi:Ricin-type beta-trefoil lectin domain